MSAHTPHELLDEFPRDAQVLHFLKLGNSHFNTLAERYHAVNRVIHRIESEIEPSSDFHCEGLKKRRLHLLDEIAEMIEEAEQELVIA
ncbi:MAG: DUF465 domain-containing protein [Pseudomonadota bacterium]